MAAAVLAKALQELGDQEHDVRSCGTQVRRSASVGDGARAALAEAGVPLTRIGSTQLTVKDLRTADLIICLTEEIRKIVADKYHCSGPKAVTLFGLSGEKRDVLEPKSASLEANRSCLELLTPALKDLAARLV